MYLQSQPKNISINMRVNEAMRDFIDYAAQTAGKGRSDFMLEAACEKAEDTLLDRRLFLLDEKQWDEFNAILDNPPAPNERLKALMAKPAPWKK